MKFVSLPVYLIFELLLLGLLGCSRDEVEGGSGNADQKVYPMAGIVRAVQKDDAILIVEHEDVPGFMPAMTMPFNVRDLSILENVKGGDAISFEFVMSEDQSWIRKVQPVNASTLNLPDKKDSSVRPLEQSKLPRLSEGDEMPDFQLVDQKGRTISAETFAGTNLVLTFIFTRCPVPDFCPRMSNYFKEVEEAIKADSALAPNVRLLSISFDPEHDTASVLADYADSHTNDGDFWRFASGSLGEIRKLTHAFSLYTERADGTINHGLCTAWVDSEGIIRKIWRGNAWAPDDILRSLRGERTN